MTLAEYRTLGRSGLAVSPLALGTMTFGTARWGSSAATSRDIFDAYLDAGGNFIDTADVYSGGRCEEMLGEFIADRAVRDAIVIATKSGFSTGHGVHLGGNGAKHVRDALEGSLRRLRTDYVDMLWVHVWDSVTPAEELLETMSNLIKAGKVRYWGFSNTPAWYVAKVATLAAVRGQPAPIALQYFYSLVNRDIEEEFVPLAAEFNMAIQPWSPLAFGMLTRLSTTGRLLPPPRRATQDCRETPQTLQPNDLPMTSGWTVPIHSATRCSRTGTGASSKPSSVWPKHVASPSRVWLWPG